MKYCHALFFTAAFCTVASLAMAQTDDWVNSTADQRKAKIAEIQENLRDLPPDERDKVRDKMKADIAEKYKPATPLEQQQLRELQRGISDPKMTGGESPPAAPPQ